MNFQEALKILLHHEGGYVNHPSDPGGETNYGITKRTAMSAGYYGDMKAIPMSVVEDIYRRNYWDAVYADKLPESLQAMVFDAAVNSGPMQAIKWLQEALSIEADGLLGPKTFKTLLEAPDCKVAMRFCALRLEFLAKLKTFPVFGVGWTRRVSSYMKG